MRHSITMDVFYSLAILYSVAEERQKIITWQIPWKNLILPEWYQVGIEWNTTSNSGAILASAIPPSINDRIAIVKVELTLVNSDIKEQSLWRTADPFTWTFLTNYFNTRII